MTLTIDDDDVDLNADLANGVADENWFRSSHPARNCGRIGLRPGRGVTSANNTSVKNNWNNDLKSVYAERR